MFIHSLTLAEAFALLFWELDICDVNHPGTINCRKDKYESKGLTVQFMLDREEIRIFDAYRI